MFSDVSTSTRRIEKVASGSKIAWIKLRSGVERETGILKHLYNFGLIEVKCFGSSIQGGCFQHCGAPKERKGKMA